MWSWYNLSLIGDNLPAAQQPEQPQTPTETQEQEQQNESQSVQTDLVDEVKNIEIQEHHLTPAEQIAFQQEEDKRALKAAENAQVLVFISLSLYLSICCKGYYYNIQGLLTRGRQHMP